MAYTAWHLRQDGKEFPVKVHIYCMGDDDLSSEAEASAFIINTNSKDKDVAERTLYAWMTLLLEEEVSYDATGEDIFNTLKSALNNLPYKFAYPLSTSTLLDIYNSYGAYLNVDELYETADDIKDNLEKIQGAIKKSLNQQFCRVRFGGQYNTVSSNNEIWFRVSSIGYNWANTIYLFAHRIHRAYHISQISICRDMESDEGFASQGKEYFYKAKDGTYYKHMPIEEFFNEEHEHSLVFENYGIGSGILHSMRECLAKGMTYEEITRAIPESSEYNGDLWRYFVRSEARRNCVPVRPENSVSANQIHRRVIKGILG